MLIDGAAYLSRCGAPSKVVSLVAFHTGAEFEAEERDLTARLELFARPDQADLDLLILADFVSDRPASGWTLPSRLLQADERAVRRDLPDQVFFMLATGCRIGEALAVLWSEVDLESGTVDI